MDYKEKYEKAYKLLEQIHAGGIVSKIDIENTFPELKKKSVISMLKIAIANTAWLDCDKNKCLSWIEKQGNTNETINRDKFAQDILKGAAINLITWIDYNVAEGNMCLSNMECEDIENALVNGNWDKIYAYIKKKLLKQGEEQGYNPYKATIESISTMVEKYANGDLKDFYDNIKVKCKDAMEYDKTWLEKQGEQNSTPKFKVGDWIVFNNDHDSIYQIEKIENYEYTLRHILGGLMCLSFSHENMIRKWTIEDAKDGNVLTYRLNSGRVLIMIYEGLGKSFDEQVNVHALLDGDGYFNESAASVCCKFMELLTPATKEQRDLLFQKMKEAGYEWDTDKKVLVTVGIDNDKEDERYEELMGDDETNIEQNLTNSYCKEHCKGFQETGKCFADGECKAKRDGVQPYWKPTEEQLMALRDAIDNNEMKSLYDELKKL